MNVFEKLIRADDVRPSRLSTEAGDFCKIDAIVGILPATLTWLRLKTTGHYVIQPWWVYKAIHDVDKLLLSTDRVLEVGSGYSTLWLAERCQQICSIEENPEWYEFISLQAIQRRLDNVKLIAGESRSISSQLLASSDWEVVIIDGPRDRLKIFRDVLALTKRPRVLIYDDTDKQENRVSLDEEATGYRRRVYRGFKPQTLHVCETTVFTRVEG